MIRISQCYDFTEPVENDPYSPLESALMNKKYKAADYLIKYRAYARGGFIEHLYIVALGTFSKDKAFPVQLVARFKHLIHFRYGSK